MRSVMRFSASILVLGLLLAPVPARALDPQPEPATGREAKSQATASRFMAAAAHPLAAEAGREVLRAGGNAVDAAIAVQFVLNLVEPQSSGIGGGAFLLYWNARTRELVTLDGRETAPTANGTLRRAVPVARQ